MNTRNRNYSLAMVLAARAAHREIFAEPAYQVRLRTVRGQRTLVQFDKYGDGYPFYCSKRAWRQLVYRTPLGSDFEPRAGR